MRNLSVVAKLWLAFTVLLALALVPLELALHRLLNDFYRNQVTEPLLYHSNQLAEMLAMDPEALRLAPMIGQMVGGEVLVLGPDGRPLDFPGGSGATPPPPAVRAALAKVPFAGRVETPAGETIVTAVPVPHHGGAVVLLAPAEPVRQSLDLARRYLWLAGGGTLLAGTGVALMLARSLLRPVIEMERATRQIARGDFSARVAVPSTDEIGQLAAAVNQMTAQLASFENRRREFLANVAHELRTPLSYIRGYTQALAEGLVPAPEERDRYLRLVHEESIRLGRLVDDLLDLAQVEEGQMTFDLAPLDVRVPVGQAVSTIAQQAEAQGLQVEVHLQPDLPQPVADGGRIQQVLLNLLDNALRHTPPGGVIAVSARAEPGAVLVSVANSGEGIEPEALPLIFERFHKRRSGGRGLGLAIARSIIRAHGGELGAESAPGAGATFWFRLPSPPAAPA